tara:strand:+ start:653 stop:931 length:279 start_codon:yes stop_codon:yes gene_type:complete
MITNKITPKYLALYSIFKEYDNYTIDNNNLLVNANLQISYNLSDIEELIISTNSKLEDANNDEDISTEYKEALREDYDEILEILNTIKEKLS